MKIELEISEELGRELDERAKEGLATRNTLAELALARYIIGEKRRNSGHSGIIERILPTLTFVLKTLALQLEELASKDTRREKDEEGK